MLLSKKVYIEGDAGFSRIEGNILRQVGRSEHFRVQDAKIKG